MKHTAKKNFLTALLVWGGGVACLQAAPVPNIATQLMYGL